MFERFNIVFTYLFLLLLLKFNLDLLFFVSVSFLMFKHFFIVFVVSRRSEPGVTQYCLSFWFVNRDDDSYESGMPGGGWLLVSEKSDGKLRDIFLTMNLTTTEWQQEQISVDPTNKFVQVKKNKNLCFCYFYVAKYVFPSCTCTWLLFYLFLFFNYFFNFL